MLYLKKENAQVLAAEMCWEMVTTGCCKSMTYQIAGGKLNVGAFLIEVYKVTVLQLIHRLKAGYWLPFYPSELRQNWRIPTRKKIYIPTTFQKSGRSDGELGG